MAQSSTVHAEQVGERHGGGRPLDATRDEALRDAALKLLAEVGYERLTMDAVASCAGAGKATIYRRWSNKAELILDALTCQKHLVAIPDTGSLRNDLTTLFERGAKKSDFEAKLVVGLMGAIPHDDELRDAFREQIVDPLESALTVVFERAVARREIEPISNVALVVSIMPALILYQQMLAGEFLSSSLVTSIVDDVFIPLVRFVNPHATTRKTNTAVSNQRG